MAIITTTINMNQAQFAVNAPVVRQKGATSSAAVPQAPDPVPMQKHEVSRLVVGQRQSINSSLNGTAISIRTADRTMRTIGNHINSMRSQLDIIVKHYPPFLSTSPDRIKALRSFSAFRKEIDELTVPPLDNGAAKIMADPAVFPQAGSQTVDLGNGGSGTIQGQQVHTGSTGLNIPALSDTATDAEIHAAIKSLDAAQITLGQRQTGMSMDWAVIVPSGKYVDATAEKTSAELGRSIAQASWQAFPGIRPLLSQLA
jgi:hypothetical protein